MEQKRSVRLGLQSAGTDRVGLMFLDQSGDVRLGFPGGRARTNPPVEGVRATGSGSQDVHVARDFMLALHANSDASVALLAKVATMRRWIVGGAALPSGRRLETNVCAPHFAVTAKPFSFPAKTPRG